MEIEEFKQTVLSVACAIGAIQMPVNGDNLALSWKYKEKFNGHQVYAKQVKIVCTREYEEFGEKQYYGLVYLSPYADIDTDFWPTTRFLGELIDALGGPGLFNEKFKQAVDNTLKVSEEDFDFYKSIINS